MLLLLAVSSAMAQNKTSKYTFSHTDTTTAPMDRLWEVWTDVPKWNEWDTGLKSAELNGPFAVGTKGRLIPNKGPKSDFEIVELQPMQGYTFRTSIPLGYLIVKRSSNPLPDGRIAFTHQVTFTGGLKWLFFGLLGKEYKAMLPDVLAKIKQKAEAKSQ